MLLATAADGGFLATSVSTSTAPPSRPVSIHRAVPTIPMPTIAKNHGHLGPAEGGASRSIFNWWIFSEGSGISCPFERSREDVYGSKTAAIPADIDGKTRGLQTTPRLIFGPVRECCLEHVFCSRIDDLVWQF